MRKRSSKKPDATVLAADIVAKANKDATEGKNPAAVALGRLGGKKGGPARAVKLSQERRRDIAKRAAEARWRKREE